MTTTPDLAVTADRLRVVLADLAVVVDAVDDGRRHAPTPCSEFDVDALVDHVVGWLTTFAAGFADPEGRAPRADLTGYRAPSDPGAEVRGAADRLDAALADGAAARPLYLGDAPMPGDLALRLVLAEYQVHGWDLSVALGRPWAPAEDGLEDSAGFLSSMLTDEMRGSSFGARVLVTDDAPALDRLLAVSGRDPAWTPPAVDRDRRPAAGFGCAGSMRTLPGRRDEVVAILGRGADALRAAGCRSYVVGADEEDTDLIRVTEVWESREHHAASLDLVTTKEAIAEALPLLTGEFSSQRFEVLDVVV